MFESIVRIRDEKYNKIGGICIWGWLIIWFAIFVLFCKSYNPVLFIILIIVSLLIIPIIFCMKKLGDAYRTSALYETMVFNVKNNNLYVVKNNKEIMIPFIKKHNYKNNKCIILDNIVRVEGTGRRKFVYYSFIGWIDEPYMDEFESNLTKHNINIK